jgi:uncharacterized membrane protein YeiH
MERFIFFLEILGTMAFSVSGAMTAMRKKMDIFGVIILGITTAVGGGMLRDIVLGNHPPRVFSSPIYLIVATAVAVLVFLPALRRWMANNQLLFDQLLRIMDALGLGIFTVVGVQVGYETGYELGFYLLTFLGTITGVGGGVIRDMMAGDRPYIFIKHVYACASLAGAAVCVVLWEPAGRLVAMMVGLALVVALRLLAAHFRWSLPKAEEFGEE